jgi:hypothetical protein
MMVVKAATISNVCEKKDGKKYEAMVHSIRPF